MIVIIVFLCYYQFCSSDWDIDRACQLLAMRIPNVLHCYNVLGGMFGRSNIFPNNIFCKYIGIDQHKLGNITTMTEHRSIIGYCIFSMFCDHEIIQTISKSITVIIKSSLKHWIARVSILHWGRQHVKGGVWKCQIITIFELGFNSENNSLS